MNHIHDDDNRGNSFQDQWLRCHTCSMEFLHSARDAAFYERMSFSTPRNCKPYRDARKAQSQGGLMAAEWGTNQLDTVEGNHETSL